MKHADSRIYLTGKRQNLNEKNAEGGVCISFPKDCCFKKKKKRSAKSAHCLASKFLEGPPFPYRV